MIVSETHKYAFIQFPHSGCTAIGRELVDHYGGEPVLWKHAMHHDFLRWAGNRADRFFLFSSIRDPMEEVVSVYHKLRSEAVPTVVEGS